MSKKQLQNCCTFISDGDHLSPPKTERGIPFVTISNITTDNQLSFENVMYVPLDYYNSLAQPRKAKKGDILYSVVGSYGKAVYLSENIQFVFQRHIAILRPSDSINGKYLYYAMLNPNFKNNVDSLVIGCAQKTLTLSALRSIEISLHDIPSQNRIASILGVLDQKIQNNKRIIAELEAMAQTLYDYWFVQFDFPDAQGKPYKSSGGKMVYNTQLKREIPDGWEVKTLSEISTIVGGSTPSTSNSEYFANDGICWITPKDLSNTNGLKLILKGAISLSDKGVKAASLTILPKGSVLMSSRAPVGYLAIAVHDTATNQGLKSFIPNMGWGSSYIYETIRHIMPIIKSKSTGSTFKEVSASDLKTIAWYAADIKIADIFEKITNPINEQLRNKLIEKQKLTQLRDWLLPMLMNGQVLIKCE